MTCKIVIDDIITINSDSDTVAIFESGNEIVSMVVVAKSKVWVDCVPKSKLINILGEGTVYTFDAERMKAIVDIVGDKITFELFLSCLERE